MPDKEQEVGGWNSLLGLYRDRTNALHPSRNVRGRQAPLCIGEGHSDVRYDPQSIMLVPFSKESFGTLRSQNPLRYPLPCQP